MASSNAFARWTKTAVETELVIDINKLPRYGRSHHFSHISSGPQGCNDVSFG
jgi:hypothetical protein